jgi:hypothetical protein
MEAVQAAIVGDGLLKASSRSICGVSRDTFCSPESFEAMAAFESAVIEEMPCTLECISGFDRNPNRIALS